MADDRLEELREFAGRAMQYKQGEVVSLMMHVGDRLGLYKAMAGAGPLTAAELAQRSGLQERWLLEWLRNQAAAEIIAHRGGDRFELTDVGAEALTDENSTFHIAGWFFPPVDRSVIEGMVEAFRTGIGLTWDDHGPDATHWLQRTTGPQHRALVSRVLPLMEGVVPRLEKGAKVVDIGCGAGEAVLAIAKAFPESRIRGLDPSQTAIDRARSRAEDAGLTNVEFTVMAGEELPPSRDCDLITTLDCMHDMTHPEQCVRAVRAALKEDGTWLIKDIRSASTFEENRKNPMLAMMYGFSVTYCMSSALSEPGGAGLGTLGFHPEVARKMTSEGGFSHFRTLDYDEDAFNSFYEVRP